VGRSPTPYAPRRTPRRERPPGGRPKASLRPPLPPGLDTRRPLARPRFVDLWGDGERRGAHHPRSRMYAMSKSAPFRSGTAVPIPAITAGPSLFARSSTRWCMRPVARQLAPVPWAQEGRGNQRAYPVQDGTRGAFHPPAPLGSYFTPGEMRPNDTAPRRNRVPHRPGAASTMPPGRYDEA